MAVNFYPGLLNDSQSLKNYFLHSPAIDRINARKATPFIPPSENRLYLSRFQVVWIYCTAPFAHVGTLFLRVISWLLSVLQLRALSLGLKMVATHIKDGLHHLNVQNKWSNRLLIPSMNTPKLASCHTYMRSPLAVAAVKDLKVRKLHISHEFFAHYIKAGLKSFFKKISVTQEKQSCKQFKKNLLNNGVNIAMEHLKQPYLSNQGIAKATSSLYSHILKQQNQRRKHQLDSIRFYREDGGCRGASEWFALLFLITEQAYKDKNLCTHLAAVAEEFLTGYSSEAALLVPFTRAQKLLGIKATIKKKHTLFSYELEKQESLCLKKLEELQKGIYCVGFPTHRTVYIKESNRSGYYWNINEGLIDLSGKDHIQLLFEQLKEWQLPGSHKSVVYFEHMELLSP